MFLNYDKVHFSPSIISLYFNRFLIQVGAGIIGIFGVIFFYEKFNSSITKVIVMYIVLHLGYVLLTSVGAMFLKRLGMRRMMIIAVPFLVLSVLARFFWDSNPFLYLILFMLFITLYKIMYWVPYHIDFAKFTDKRTRGRQVAILSNISQAALVFTPLIGGFIISRQGYESLFLASAIIIFLSILPLFFVKETYEKYSFGWLQTYKEMFKRENRPLLVANIGNGMQDAVGVIIWPIFIFQVLKGNYLSVGFISSVTIIALIILRFIIGNLGDTWGEKKVLRMGSIIYTTGWIIKIFVETGLGIFLADTYHKLGKVVNKMPFDVTIYEQAADNGHYIDEYTVLKETSLLLGKGLMLLFSLAIIYFWGITATFIVAAIATLSMTVITNRAIKIK
jgi:YQGE family putative transporter